MSRGLSMTQSAAGKLQVVDPHIHLWDLATGLYPRRQARGPRKSAMKGDYLLPDLRRDAQDVEIVAAVHVEAFPTDGLAEARHVQAMADADSLGLPQAIVAYADLSSPWAEKALEALVALPNMRGIRQVLDRWVERPGTVSRDLLDDAAWHEGVRQLSRHDLSFEVQMRPDQLAAVSSLIDRNPDTRFVLNHLGPFTASCADDRREWRDSLRILAARPNVWLKLSGFGMYLPSVDHETVGPLVHEALEAFGPRRAMFASNFPVDGKAVGLAALWKIFAAVAGELSPHEQDALLRGNARKFYRI
ncbi:MAG: amidohydrolase family protein [Azospirillaceae bacterium]